MADLTGYDATKYDPNKSFDPIPAGKYPAVIVASEWCETKKKDGQYLKFTLQIVDGQYKGRKVFDNLNLKNKSTQTVEIANKTLSAICHAVNVLQPGDSAALHNKPLMVSVKVAKDQNGNPSNDVKGYEPLQVAQAATPQPGNGEAKPEDAVIAKPWG